MTSIFSSLLTPPHSDESHEQSRLMAAPNNYVTDDRGDFDNDMGGLGGIKTNVSVVLGKLYFFLLTWLLQ